MTLRKKTLLIISVTIISLMLIVFVTSQRIVLRSFLELEEESTRQHVERVLAAINADFAKLSSTVRDWSSWGETYAFANGEHETYIEDNLTDAILANLRLNLIAFVDASDHLIYGKALNWETQEAFPVPQSFQAQLTPTSVILRHTDMGNGVQGFLLLPEGILMLVSRPILNDEGQGPTHGSLIMGRYLNAFEITRLSDITHLSLTAYPFHALDLPADFRMAREHVSKDSPSFIHPQTPKMIMGYALLNDIYGKPGLIFRVDIAREIYQHGQTSVQYFLTSLLIACLVLGGIMVWFLEYVILSRLAQFNTNVNNIRVNHDLSVRIAVAGNDEITNLARGMNEMLAALHESQRKLEDQNIQLAELNASKDKFFSIISHDLRAPLSTVIGYGEYLEQRIKAQAITGEVEEISGKLRSSTKSLSTLLENLLTWSRLQRGVMTYEPGELNLAESMEDIMFIFTPTAEQKRITLVNHVQSAISVYADEIMLKTILRNLVSNALKFTNAGDLVTISATPAEASVEIAVSDTGCGIDQEGLAKLFRIDAHYSNVGTAGEKGTGLGLILCKELVEQNGGRIGVESEAPKGTTFRFTLPSTPP